MQPWVPFVALALLAVQVPHASGQELRFDRPQPEHQLLERLAGEWEFQRLSPPGQGTDRGAEQGAEPQVLGQGTVSGELVGAFFLVSQWSGTIYGMDYHAVQTLGFDIERGRYAGQWMDSFMSYQWALTGSVDEASQEFTLTTRGPAPTGGTTGFRERYRFESPDTITIYGEMEQGERWVALTTTRLTRRP